jgi:hypothetical protein
MVHQNSLNQEESKNFRQEHHKPKDNENTKIEPHFSRIWVGNQREKNHEGFMHTSPKNPQENGLEISPRKSPRKGSENHQKGKPGRTQTSLEEPRRIIYTYHEGSYKV